MRLRPDLKRAASSTNSTSAGKVSVYSFLQLLNICKNLKTINLPAEVEFVNDENGHVS